MTGGHRSDTESGPYEGLAQYRHGLLQAFSALLTFRNEMTGDFISMQGEAAAGVEVIESALVEWRKMQQRYMEPHICALLAEAEMAAANWHRAKVILSDALAMADQTGERFFMAELHRLSAAASLRLGDGDAEARLRLAMQVASEQRAKSLELRAARDLARLWAEQGERQRAYDLLFPVHDWFTEGFDTPDLIEARELLDSLR